MTRINVCCKCGKPYHNYTTYKTQGYINPSNYMKYLCKPCYEKLVNSMKHICCNTILIEELEE